MRYTFLIAALLVAHPLMATDTNNSQIGKFTLTLGQQALVLVSDASPKRELSDLYFADYQDVFGQSVRSYTIQASTGLDIDTNPKHPTISVEFDLDPDTKTLVVQRVIFVDHSWDTPFVSYPEIPHPDIEVTDLIFREDGGISFRLRADLLRIDMETYKPLPKVETITIQGQYSGKFPQFALQYPRVFGDY